MILYADKKIILQKKAYDYPFFDIYRVLEKIEQSLRVFHTLQNTFLNKKQKSFLIYSGNIDSTSLQAEFVL